MPIKNDFNSVGLELAKRHKRVAGELVSIMEATLKAYGPWAAVRFLGDLIKMLTKIHSDIALVCKAMGDAPKEEPPKTPESGKLH